MLDYLFYHVDGVLCACFSNHLLYQLVLAVLYYCFQSGIHLIMRLLGHLYILVWLPSFLPIFCHIFDLLLQIQVLHFQLLLFLLYF